MVTSLTAKTCFLISMLMGRETQPKSGLHRQAEGIMCLFIPPLPNQLLFFFLYTMSATCNSTFLFSNKDSSLLGSIVQWSALGVRQGFFSTSQKTALASMQQKQKMKKTTKQSRLCSRCALILSAFPKTGLCCKHGTRLGRPAQMFPRPPGQLISNSCLYLVIS